MPITLLVGLNLALALPAGVGADTPANDALPAALWPGNERVRQVLEPTTDFSQAEAYELMQGGGGTQRAHQDRHAYSQHMASLAFESRHGFHLGEALFDKFWVASPSSTLASDGLGPFYNARACQSCHVGNGRGQLPRPDEPSRSLLLRLGKEQQGQWAADPVYGHQLHGSAIAGVAAEGRFRIRNEPVLREFADGTQVVLQKPAYELVDLAYGELHPATRVSARIAPALPGLGLLEAIEPAHILAYADPQDRDGDGISGRVNRVKSLSGEWQTGRFAHKAAVASVREQNLIALFHDMGLSSESESLRNPHGDCTPAQSVCESLAHGEQAHLGNGEATSDVVDLITFYTRHLAVPARRDVNDPQVLQGKRLFHDSGCQACHVPKHVTSAQAEQPEMRFQLIWPYTDLLLHDMGEPLADALPEGVAHGREWRTAPLWGIGLAQTVNPDARFLHDGRAATLLEAVLWHGGEAEAALEHVLAMSAAERNALIRFLESL